MLLLYFANMKRIHWTIEEDGFLLVFVKIQGGNMTVEVSGESVPCLLINWGQSSKGSGFFPFLVLIKIELQSSVLSSPPATKFSILVAIVINLGSGTSIATMRTAM